MSIFEIVSAIVLIVACVFIVVVILVKDTKTRMSQTMTGTTNDSFYQKNAGRTKEAMLNKATIAAAVIFFALAVAVNLINVYGNKDNTNNSTPDDSNMIIVDASDHDDDADDTPADSTSESDNESPESTVE